MALITEVVSSLLSRVIGDEISAWVPGLCRALVRCAAARLPESQRARFSEEWQSHIDEIPGIFVKLLTAADFSRAAIGMVMSQRHKEAAEKWVHTAQHFKESHSKVVVLLNRVVSIEGVATIEAATPHVARLNGFREHLEKISNEVAKLPVVLSQYAEEPCTFIQRVRNRRALKQIHQGLETVSAFATALDQIALEGTKALARKGYN